MNKNDLFKNLKAADKGDKTALAKLREELSESDENSIISYAGDIAYQAEESLLSAMLGDREGTKECIRQELQRLRIELGWRESSALERILIERVVATWLSLYQAEWHFNRWNGGSISEAEYYQHRIDRTQRRHLSAVKMLATVRKMALPLLVDIKAEINLNETKANSSKQPFENRFEMLTSNN